MKTEANPRPLEVDQRFKEIRPSDLVFDLTWHILNLTEILGQTFWKSFMNIKANMWPLVGEQGFKAIWPSDLVFDPTWPIFQFDQDLIKTNILI